MPLRDFWFGVRDAVGYPSPPTIIDALPLDPAAVERSLREGMSWLSRETVAGFDLEELGFLPGPKRDRLAELVGEFRAVASTAEAVNRAWPPLLGIATILEFDRFGDPEAFRLGTLIEREIEPDRTLELAELRFQAGLDHSGDPALWIWAIIAAEASDTDARFLEATERAEDWLEPAARRLAGDRWPYLYFRSFSDQYDPEPMEAP